MSTADLSSFREYRGTMSVKCKNSVDEDCAIVCIVVLDDWLSAEGALAGLWVAVLSVLHGSDAFKPGDLVLIGLAGGSER